MENQLALGASLKPHLLNNRARRNNTGNALLKAYTGITVGNRWCMQIKDRTSFLFTSESPLTNIVLFPWWKSAEVKELTEFQLWNQKTNKKNQYRLPSDERDQFARWSRVYRFRHKLHFFWYCGHQVPLSRLSNDVEENNQHQSKRWRPELRCS